uniref:(northern house mosquito) hypothetical protein n=1 Tax=Culex pipiens TaxID=7175 RepID=A0A8D8C320_CULPI
MMNKVLEGIQDAIILSKNSIIANRLLNAQELTFIRSLLIEEGVNSDLPDEALQHVTPKFAVNKELLLYILHVPRLFSKTVPIIQVYPLAHKNQIIFGYPEFFIKDGSTLYTTNHPDEFVQKLTYLEKIQDTCIYPLIFGTQSRCNATFFNDTTQMLISEKALLIQNSWNGMLQTNCGPDNRTLSGNFVIEFINCSITFNNQTYQNEEITRESNIIYGAFHNFNANWTYKQRLDISSINNETLGNRKKLDHVFLEQYHLKLQIWTVIGGLSVTYIIILFIVLAVAKILLDHRGSGRSELHEGAVTKQPGPAIFEQLEELNRQQQQLATALETLREG